MKHWDVIVIGAGAAGMMCAAQAGRRGRRVLLIDHADKLGERIRISGGGRCNFSNRTVTANNFLSRNGHFCRSALAQFSQNDFIALVTRHGVRYEERDHGQLFCVDSAQDIIELLKKECADGGVEWAMPCAVHSVSGGRDGGDDGDPAAAFELVTDQGTMRCRSLVVATGGLAVPKLGATPFGYRLAEQFELKIVPPKPALVPLSLEPETLARFQELSGVSLDVETGCDGVTGLPATSFRESLLLTHRGLSGPAVLQISSYWQSQDYGRHRHEGGGRKAPIRIDLLPGVDATEWLNNLQGSRALLANVLAERLPRRFAQAWAELETGNAALNNLSHRDLQRIGHALNHWELMPSGTLGYAKAEVTLGGVDTNELSSKTMAVRAVPGLYFIGEVVDVTGWLGGFNFQWAWSSGWVAGQHA
jgi:predicted Rossmann fold flavoprotein